MSIIDELKAEIEICDRILHDCKSNESTFISFKNNHGRSSYYFNGKYISQKEKAKLISLLQKRYYKELADITETEKNSLMTLISTIADSKGQLQRETFMDLWPKEARSMINCNDNTESGFAQIWQREQYQKKNVDSKYPFFTIRKEHVRSKSEVIIADRLHFAGVPYHYEKMMVLGNCIPVYPDFTVLNKRLRKEFIWEHFGMMDNPDYVKKAVLKINDYQQNGFFIGKNLITTFETTECPVNPSTVDKIIQEFLI